MGDLAEYFPFKKFFENAPQPIFKGNSYEEDFDIAEGCFRHVKKIFTQLEASRLTVTEPFSDCFSLQSAKDTK